MDGQARNLWRQAIKMHLPRKNPSSSARSSAGQCPSNTAPHAHVVLVLVGMHLHAIVVDAIEDELRRDEATIIESVIAPSASLILSLWELWETEIDAILDSWQTSTFKLMMASDIKRIDTEFETYMQA